MGHIYDDHGRIAIEGRRESFYIHAGYGYEVGRARIGELSVGDEFIAARDGAGEDRLWKVSLVAEDRVEGREAVSSVIQTFPPDVMVVIPGREVPSDHPLGRFWREVPHPEFENADVDDLIAALEAYREAIK